VSELTDDVRSWEEVGAVHIGSFLSAHDWAELEREAQGFQAEADHVEHSRIEMFRDGHLTSPKRDWVHSGGPFLAALARSRELLGQVRQKTSLPQLIPSRFGYKYYRKGDYMGVHRDSVRSSVTVTFALTSNLGPMRWDPGRRSASNEDVLLWIYPDNYLPQGKDFPVTYRVMHAFDGYNIPHWRMPFNEELGILGTISFFNLD
jgi:hypothetical protein